MPLIRAGKAGPGWAHPAVLGRLTGRGFKGQADLALPGRNRRRGEGKAARRNPPAVPAVVDFGLPGSPTLANPLVTGQKQRGAPVIFPALGEGSAGEGHPCPG